jgi:hypothetical protein
MKGGNVIFSQYHGMYEHLNAPASDNLQADTNANLYHNDQTLHSKPEL